MMAVQSGIQSVPPPDAVRPAYSASRTGGVLSIISGVFGIIGSIALFFFTVAGMAEKGSFQGEEPPFTLLFVLSFLMAFAGVLAVIGGTAALRRRNWGLALAGAIASLFSGAAILGILAVVFVAAARKEFPS